MILQCRLDRQFEKYKSEYESATLSVLNSGVYIQGENVKSFEENFSRYTGIKNCIGVGNGTDALCIALMALGIGEGDEVIIPANAFVASWIAICSLNAKAVAVDICDDFNINPSLIEEKITDKTKAILVQHLYGKPCRMSEICAIAKKHRLFLLEDCAQAVGAKNAGTFGDIACFSFYPTKNLGAFGDGGAIVTNDTELSEKCRRLANYGSVDRVSFTEIGRNSRLDEIQASLLNVTLSHIDEIVLSRKTVVKCYLNEIKNSQIILPTVKIDEHAFHQFVVRVKDRDRFIQYLSENGIGSRIHYEKPVYLSPAYSFLNYKEEDFPKNTELNAEILSLPLYFGMTEDEIKYIIKVINDYE